MNEAKELKRNDEEKGERENKQKRKKRGKKKTAVVICMRNEWNRE